MDFHALDRRGGAHIMTTHRAQDDETPLQLISAQELARLKALETAVLALMALLPPVVGNPGPANTPDCSKPE